MAIDNSSPNFHEHILRNIRQIEDFRRGIVNFRPIFFAVRAYRLVESICDYVSMTGCSVAYGIARLNCRHCRRYRVEAYRYGPLAERVNTASQGVVAMAPPVRSHNAEEADQNLIRMFDRLRETQHWAEEIIGIGSNFENLSQRADAIRTFLRSRNLSSITEIDLSGLSLSAIPPEIQLLTHLRELHLENNNITTLTNVQFPPYVEMLYLHYNRLTTLTNAQFPPNLWHLSLGHNLMRTLTGAQFPPFLESLYLDANQIETLTNARFPNLLQRLDLTGNLISTVEGIQIPNSLERLDLGYNLLRTFSFNLLRAHPHLQTINLQHNQITALDNDLPDTYLEVNLDGNRIEALNMVIPTRWHIQINTLTPPLANTALQNIAPAVVNHSPEAILASSQAVQLNNHHLNIHRLIIQKRPEYVLQMIALRARAGQFPSITFLRDNLTPEESIDAGGPRADFISMLFTHLFDNQPDRILRQDLAVKEFLVFQNKAEEAKTLNVFGSMLQHCLMNNTSEARDESGRIPRPILIGRKFSDSYFQFLKNVIVHPSDDLDSMIEICECLMSAQHQLLASFHLGRPLTNEMKEALTFLGVNDPQDNQATRDELRQIFIDYINQYRPHVKAAREIVKGMSDINVFLGREASEISRLIQGNPFDPANIASKFISDNQETRWIQEHIMNANTSKEWIQNLLIMITGQQEVTNHSKIRISPIQNGQYQAHTCTPALDVPAGLSKEDFINYLTAFISGSRTYNRA